MKKIAICYWSGTGNTQAMAEAVEAGARAAGGDARLFAAADFDPGQVDAFDAIAFGCPAMGAEELETEEFEPVFQACEGKLSGKPIALFGSYGWGDGEWMSTWEDTCRSAGADPEISADSRRMILKYLNKYQQPEILVELGKVAEPYPDTDFGPIFGER